MGLFIHFYIIFGTNLLTQGPVQIFFLPISVFRRKRISNGVQTEWKLREHDFWNKRDPEDLEWTSSNRRGGHKAWGRAYPPPARPPPSWAPRGSTDLLLPPIYTYIPWKHRRAPWKPNSTSATFCTQEIPSWGLFRSAARGGIDHGGPLHQLHGLSDDVWGVYLGPSGP